MHNTTVKNGVRNGDNRFGTPGQSALRLEEVDKLPLVPEKFKGLNH